MLAAALVSAFEKSAARSYTVRGGKGIAAGDQRNGGAGKPHAPDAQERAARDMNIAESGSVRERHGNFSVGRMHQLNASLAGFVPKGTG
jgi:hypothetical protein